MGLSDWFSKVPFNIVPANAQGESSTGPRATSSAAGVDDNDRSADGQDQQVVVFDPNAPRVVLPMEPEPAYKIFAGQELPEMQYPYVNPLAGMIDRPDPELSEEEKMNAYEEMMERFQVGDPEAPLETKSYWPSETGPVTREHFDEYKAWAEDQIRKANTLSLESASTLWKQARELAREKKVREDAEKKLTAQGASQAGTVHRWVTEDRGALRKPRYTDPDDTEEREAERGRFLSKNRSWRMKELRVTTLLLRAQVAVENEGPSKALDCLYEARKLVVQFQFPALEARCEFWRGRAEYFVDSYDNALAAFWKALPCVGVYREGLEVKEWIRKAQIGLGNPPEPQMRTRSLRRRPRPDSFVGGGEHPPRFGFDDDDDDDDEDENTGKHSSGFGLGEKSNAGEDLQTGGHRQRFSLNDEFDEDDDEHHTAVPTEDKEIIEEAMQELGFTPQATYGGRPSGSALPEMPLGGGSSTERTTGTVNKGKRSATVDDLLDEDE